MNRNQWAQKLVAVMGWQPGVVDGVVAQASAENSGALCNPLDTTEPWDGASDYNSVGVKNYPDTGTGLAATRATLENGYYAGMLSAGAAGDSLGYVNACAASPWGTWHDQADAQMMLAAVRASPAYGEVEVAGTGGPEPAPPAPPPSPVPAPPPTPPVPSQGEPMFACVIYGDHVHVFGEVAGVAYHWWQSETGTPDWTWQVEKLPVPTPPAVP